MMPLNRQLSEQIAQRIRAQRRCPWQNALAALLAGYPELANAVYVEGWVVKVKSRRALEHGWLEVDSVIVDPTPPHWSCERAYFAAFRFTRAQLLQSVESVQAVAQPGLLPIARRYWAEGVQRHTYQQAADQAVGLVRQLWRADNGAKTS